VKAGHYREVQLESLALTVFESFHKPGKRCFGECSGLIGIHVAPPGGESARG
jgi:hypothetical protein